MTVRFVGVLCAGFLGLTMTDVAVSQTLLSVREEGEKSTASLRTVAVPASRARVTH